MLLQRINCDATHTLRPHPCVAVLVYPDTLCGMISASLYRDISPGATWQLAVNAALPSQPRKSIVSFLGVAAIGLAATTLLFFGVSETPGVKNPDKSQASKRELLVSQSFSEGSEPVLNLLQLCIPLNEFLGPAARETYRQSAIVVFTFNSYHCPHAIFRMPHLLPQQRIGFPNSLDR